MNQIPSPTLYDVFFPEPRHGDAAMDKMESTPQWSGLRGRLTLGRAGDLWGSARKQLGDQLHDLLHPSLGEILESAWKAHGKIVELCETTRTHPGSAAVFRGESHEVEIRYEPKLRVSLDRFPAFEIPFTARVSFSLEAIELTIRGGRIVDIAPGRCRAAGVLDCDRVEIAKFESKPLELPGHIPLGGPR
jgi:hypothetical protein